MDLLEALYAALHSAHGIRLTTNDRDKLRQAIYRARREAMDPALDAIGVVYGAGADPNELWLVKKVEG